MVASLADPCSFKPKLTCPGHGFRLLDASADTNRLGVVRCARDRPGAWHLQPSHAVDCPVKGLLGLPWTCPELPWTALTGNCPWLTLACPHPLTLFRSTGELPVWLALSSPGTARYTLSVRLVEIEINSSTYQRRLRDQDQDTDRRNGPGCDPSANMMVS